jgi:hypothetical protein
MPDLSSGFTIEPEPARNTLTIRVQHYVLDTPEALDVAMPAVLAGFEAMGWQPCYVLMDITGLRMPPRVRNYMAAQGQNTGPMILAFVVFSRQPDPVTELLMRVGSGYANIPYAFYPDEAAARADIARRQADESSVGSGQWVVSHSKGNGQLRVKLAVFAY